MAYPPEAVAKAKALYIRGYPHEHIEREMRADWPTWSRKNLYGDDGWIARYGFDEARAGFQKEVQAHEELAEQTTNDMLVELTKIRQDLYQTMVDKDQTADPQTVYAYDKVSRTIIQLLKAAGDVQAEPIDLDNNELFQILTEIPEVKDAIEKNKKAILRKIEQAA